MACVDIRPNIPPLTLEQFACLAAAEACPDVPIVHIAPVVHAVLEAIGADTAKGVQR